MAAGNGHPKGGSRCIASGAATKADLQPTRCHHEDYQIEGILCSMRLARFLYANLAGLGQPSEAQYCSACFPPNWAAWCELFIHSVLLCSLWSSSHCPCSAPAAELRLQVSDKAWKDKLCNSRPLCANGRRDMTRQSEGSSAKSLARRHRLHAWALHLMLPPPACLWQSVLSLHEVLLEPH